ncbi:PEP-CTERM sorting domain-containing protein [Geminocystis sp. GBBB08]|uniref:PEP-CTERM sorting domain-containing protein n=1 Tax=Geminocystis sp. GBBB08 TaxID=2604140 RepID=UPI0027E318EE|nr:PEP-CTERM sorting domain-containing protein [Geminocystis sp. GBBB08]MBL1208890.1 PEP-CTERM sorting domain-containing protein [Geminocystis sp. GBBB08]
MMTQIKPFSHQKESNKKLSLAFSLATLTGLAFTVGVNPAQALTFTNTVPTIDIGFMSDSSSTSQPRRADNFTLSSQSFGANLTTIRWSGYYFGTTNLGTDNFTINILDNSSNKPGTLVASFSGINSTSANRTANGTITTAQGTRNRYDFTYNLSQLLNANTQYWLSIVDNTPETTTNFYWFGSNSGGDGFSTQATSTSSWQTDSANSAGNLVFSLDYEAVPEPTLILGTLTAGLVGTFMKKKSNSINQKG